jgi:hypothetical protein
VNCKRANGNKSLTKSRSVPDTPLPPSAMLFFWRGLKVSAKSFRTFGSSPDGKHPLRASIFDP